MKYLQPPSFTFTHVDQGQPDTFLGAPKTIDQKTTAAQRLLRWSRQQLSPNGHNPFGPPLFLGQPMFPGTFLLLRHSLTHCLYLSPTDQRQLDIGGNR